MEAMSVHAWLRWDAVQRILPDDAVDVLEIGAGLGAFGAMLARRFEYVGLEPDNRSYHVAAERIGSAVRNERIEEHNGVYDIVCGFEVLEHIEDDGAALECWRQHSRRWLLVSVPLNPARFGATDIHAGHFRRYSAESLSDTLRRSGFTPRRITAYGFPAGYALEAARNAIVSRRPTPADLDERTAASGRWLQPPRAMRFLTWTAALPARAAQRPFGSTARGTGLVALAEVASRSTSR